ncbi:hypothetical protein [Gemmobacter caeruleus]|uniref:hypothetical protein n=1 Tax=Gemmobacter caeruleus TaxID=2595004 RepID=UPI0011ED01F2|nr:hypothetical protein [Gemmobacter caeruleus]
MAIGVMISGILSGLTGVVWMLLAGHPVLLALLCYPLLGFLGAAAFIALTLSRGVSLTTPEAEPAHAH